jgi:hypothetical protein
LQQQEKEREQGLRQLKAKLQRGTSQAERGELLDGDGVFEELRQMIQERKRDKKKAPRCEAAFSANAGGNNRHSGDFPGCRSGQLRCR